MLCYDVMQAIENDNWPPTLVRYKAFSKVLSVINGIVVRNDRIVLPVILRKKALDIAHRGHPGVVSMRRYLRENVWWAYMDRDVTERIQECADCTAVSSQTPAEPMLRNEMPDRARQDLAIDFSPRKSSLHFL